MVLLPVSAMARSGFAPPLNLPKAMADALNRHENEQRDGHPGDEEGPAERQSQVTKLRQ